MSLIPPRVIRMLEMLRSRLADTDFGAKLDQYKSGERVPRLRVRKKADAGSVAEIWTRLRKDSGADSETQAEIADPASVERAGFYSRNIENYIGTVKVPVGVVGPLRVNGIDAQGDYFIPLATTEAALVASYARGADIVSRVGGISAATIAEGVLRTPAFVFGNMVEAGLFINWIAENAEKLKQVAQSSTRFGRLVSIEPYMDSEIVFLMCRYTTGDAAGQNMVTVATDLMCAFIDENTPVRPQHWFVEANFSGDKKASYLGLQTGRGRKVTASVTVPNDIIRRFLHAEPEEMLAYGRVAGLGSILSGQLGAQAHYSNALAALYIATGQDAACVAESAVGFTRMEARGDAIYFAATLPNILVGSVGGGTGLPSQQAGLKMMGLAGAGKAAALAEVTAALCLCGEISIIGAMAAGHFTRAHEKLARQR
ncbi:MAG TPA: 3-hydroxy-3-methylglutaryl-CoA reductase [Devosia sp.]|nr:3-hydroxy-3-methylglutaryl-CoA reductase [Devosia sp.]